MIRRVCQCIQEFGHPELKQRCRQIKIIHYLSAKIKLHTSDFTKDNIYVYMQTISEQTKFAKLVNYIYFIVLMKKYIEKTLTYKYISIFFIF